MLHNKAKKTIFDGFPLYIFRGMKYLVNKYKKNTLLGLYLDDNKKLKSLKKQRFFDSLTIRDTQISFWCTTNKTRYSIKRDYKITYPIHDSSNGDAYFELLKNIRTTNPNIDFVICMLYFGHDCKFTSAHSNSMIFNLKKMEIERFEPHGIQNYSGINKINAIYNEFDKQFLKLCKKYKFQYFKPLDFCPRYGPQMIEEQLNDLKNFNNLGSQSNTSQTNTILPTDPGGFCAAWSLWYLDLRLKNPNIERDAIIKQSIEILKKKPIKFRQFIRNYAQFIMYYDI